MKRFQVCFNILGYYHGEDELTDISTRSCIELLPLTSKEQRLEKFIQTHIASDARAHFNAAMFLGMEAIFTNIVKFGSNDALKSNDDVREMMAHVRGELDQCNSNSNRI